MTTDLSSLDALSQSQEEGVELTVRHPVTREPLGITMRVLSYESSRVRAVQRRQQNERLKNQRRRVTAEELEANGREVQIAAVHSWTWDEGLTLDGDRWDCTPDTVGRLLSRFPFIARQIDDLADDTSAFLQS